MIYLLIRQLLDMKNNQYVLRVFSITSLLVLFMMVSSCNKCDDPLNELTGDEVIEDAIVKVISNPPEQPLLIRSASDFPGNTQIRVSLNNGYTFGQADFTKYSIVCFPTQTSCDASFSKDIKVDYINKIVKYTMGITVCDMCEYRVSQAHYVVISKIPDDYTFEYELVELN